MRRQLFSGARVALPRRLSGGPELGRRALGPGCRAKAPECLESGPKMQARVHTMALAPEVLAVEEMIRARSNGLASSASSSASSYAVVASSPWAMSARQQADRGRAQ